MRISDWSSDVCSSDLDRQMHRNAPEPLILQAWVWALGRTLLADELGPHYLEFLDGGIYTIERLIANGSGWCDDEIGRASCRESVCQYGLISVVAVSLKKTTNNLVAIQSSTNIQ